MITRATATKGSSIDKGGLTQIHTSTGPPKDTHLQQPDLSLDTNSSEGKGNL